MNVAQAVLITRKALDRLTADDIKDLSVLLGQKNSSDEKFSVLNQFMSEKGVIIPDSDEEIRQILGPLYTMYVRLGSPRQEAEQQK